MLRHVMPALTLVLALGIPLLAPLPATGADFSPITEQEKALTVVPGYPRVAAVFLSYRGDLQLLDPSRQEQSSVLTVEVRLKILTQEGLKKYGEVEILHSRWLRLYDFSGRTVLPDGRVLPLSEDAIFERQSSRSQRLTVTAAAFPGLAVGAILDYRYRLRFDTFYFLEPWTFQQEVPVLSSEVTFHVPSSLTAQAWQRDPMKVGLRSETKRTHWGSDVRVWAENVPPLLDEPFSFPEEDLSARFMLVPVQYRSSRLLDTWTTTAELVESALYSQARRNDGTAKAKSRELLGAGDAREPRQKAEILYRFVRDEIITLPDSGVLVGGDGAPDAILRAGRGGPAEKAFLLATLLDAAQVDADLIWAASRWSGTVDLAIPSFNWFDHLLVRLQLEGQEVFLDPAERGMPFGSMDAAYEGTQALVFDRRKPELIVLPESSFEQHQRRVKIDLALDEEGRLSGSGELLWTGHHGISRIAAAQLAQGGAQRLWQDWLDQRYGGLVVEDVEVEERADQGQVAVHFRLAQPEEEVLGDEASLIPSLPLGPVRQIFPLPLSQRRGPVMFNFADRNLVELTLTWPSGWELEAWPESREHTSEAGAFSISTTVDSEARTLHFTRRLDIHASRFLKREAYQQLRYLFDVAEASDVQGLALLRR